jgi:hypothetical protein
MGVQDSMVVVMDDVNAAILAEEVKLVFPNLRRLVCNGWTPLGWSVFFDILASSTVPLQALFDTTVKGWYQVCQAALNQMVRQVGSLRGLRSLQLSISVLALGADDDDDGLHQVLDLSPLSALSQLQHMHVEVELVQAWGVLRVGRAGLKAVLSSCQKLTSLRLRVPRICESQPLHSASLKVLSLGMLRPGVLPHGLDLLRLPALEHVCVEGICISESQSEEIRGLVAMLAGWPVEPR